MESLKPPLAGHIVVSENEWTEARKALLVKEKEFTRLRDELSRQRRHLPWHRIEKTYALHGPTGMHTLKDLFGKNSQLIVYHFMLGQGWEAGCKSCSYLADHFDGMLPHLNARDVTLVAVSRAPISEIEAFKSRMGWRFKWVSSYGSDFNFDFHVSFDKDDLEKGEVYYNYQQGSFASQEAPGLSVFYRTEEGEVFHTYSAYARGLDILVGTYNFLDMTPKGRDEDGLTFSMAWVRHHDRYDDGYTVDPNATYEHPKVDASLPEIKVQVKHVDPIRVAYVRHVGPYPECGAAWSKLLTALKGMGVLNDDSLSMGIPYDNPAATPAAELRYDACVAVDDDFNPAGEIGVQEIFGGDYAVATYVGSYERLADVYRALLENWMPQSGLKMGQGPCIEVYRSSWETTAPADLVTEICAPLLGQDSKASCCSEEP